MIKNRREFLSTMPVLAAGAGALLSASELLLQAQERQPDDSVEREFLNFRSQDNVSTWGLYYRPKGKNPKTTVVIMHPRSNNSQHFLAPRLAAQGYAVLGQVSRWLNNEIAATQENTLLDIAAGIRFLKENYKVEKIVCVGHSGGGGLFAFYQVQATTAPPGRYPSTPAGDPPDLNQFELVRLDGYIAMAAHKGEGRIYMSKLDPAVVDESNPLATDWTLDMFDPRNGYRSPPESSRYSPEFLARFRAAQLERARRLDAKAYALIARQRRAEEQMKSPEFARLDPQDQILIRRTAAHEEYMVTYRTAAHPGMTDLTLDPSDRGAAYRNNTNPEAGNYSTGETGRLMTPRGYLSTRSGISSRMVTDENLAKITVPTLIIGATADSAVIGLNAIRSSYEASAAKDKEIAFVKGASHGFTPVEPAAGGKDTQAEAARIIFEWLGKRFSA
ncbi:MAG: alpha/beta hydrolase [Acidobacteria bacterium]|nr:alpha/beta hydrolase [Acidobacteriota bacterium]